MTNQQLLILALAAVVAVLLLRPLLFGGPRISAAEADAKLQAGTAVLVDVREPGEWPSGVAKPAALLPLSDLRGPRRQWGAFLAQHREKQIILYCASGLRSGSAASLLRKEGFTVANLGGFFAWSQAGLPVKKP